MSHVGPIRLEPSSFATLPGYLVPPASAKQLPEPVLSDDAPLGLGIDYAAQARKEACARIDRDEWDAQMRLERLNHLLRLARALRNLVENALTHTSPGTTVEISVAGSELRVMDRGPGVPSTEREQIFQRFWRRDRRRTGSAGLGLAIVKRIAEMHEATVSVSDRAGGGSVFSIRFPAAVKADTAIERKLEPAL